MLDNEKLRGQHGGLFKGWTVESYVSGVEESGAKTSQPFALQQPAKEGYQSHLHLYCCEA